MYSQYMGFVYCGILLVLALFEEYTANTAILAVFRGSILWNTAVLEVFRGSIFWNTVGA